MPPLFLVIVGIDYSEVSCLALREASTIAGWHERSELHVVQVASLTLPLPRPKTASGAELVQDTSSDEPVARLRAWLTEELSAGGKEDDCNRRIIAHASAEARGEHVSRLAAELGADLVVVGVNESNAWAEDIAIASSCSVLLVRQKPTR